MVPKAIRQNQSIRPRRDFGNLPGFWLALQSQHDIAPVERDRGAKIDNPVRPAASTLTAE